MDITESMRKKGYQPVMGNGQFAGGFSGAFKSDVSDFWMWTGKVNEVNGEKIACTVKMTNFKEIAKHLYFDKWIPVKKLKPEEIHMFEDLLRNDKNLQDGGIKLPNVHFIKIQAIPKDIVMPDPKRKGVAPKSDIEDTINKLASVGVDIPRGDRK